MPGRHEGSTFCILNDFISDRNQELPNKLQQFCTLNGFGLATAKILRQALCFVDSQLRHEPWCLENYEWSNAVMRRHRRWSRPIDMHIIPRNYLDNFLLVR